MKDRINVLEHRQYINRELSWLEFNRRVLEEAQDLRNPLFERLKFMSITSSNLDEFYMVRVGSLWDQVIAGFNEPDPAGLTPGGQLLHISERAHRLVYNQYSTYSRSILPALRKNRACFLKPGQLSANQKDFIAKYYRDNLYPVLTPMAVDKSRPFPLVANKSLNIALFLEIADEEAPIFATVQVPSTLGRFVEMPSVEDNRCFMFVEDIIKLHINTLFKGHSIKTMACYRITRNADLGFDEEGAEDLLETIEQSIKLRKWGKVVRLEIENTMDKELVAYLQNEMDAPDEGIFRISGPLDLTFLIKYYPLGGFEHLKFVENIPSMPAAFSTDESIFDVIARKDVMLHHPYDSFKPVIDFIRMAAADPEVLAIKQTLYRVSGNSPIVEALAFAAENGKQVTVLVELKARFDEENNIIWAKRLEQAGCQVIYGLVGLKTHCKITLVVRREENGIKRYVHVGTGNYNDITARIYTDIGLFTSNPYYGSDASTIFNMLSGYSQITRLYKVEVVPGELRKKFIHLINQEADKARVGKPAFIKAKLNSLVDLDIINALYNASRAGVRIELLIRGICCLRPGVAGLSENILVHSIVGRFLEHSRIYCFHNDGDEILFISSADWMPRNLDRRIELLFPVEDRAIAARVKQILNAGLEDSVKARKLHSDGTYTRVSRRGKGCIDSQENFSKGIKSAPKEIKLW